MFHTAHLHVSHIPISPARAQKGCELSDSHARGGGFTGLAPAKRGDNLGQGIELAGALYHS